MYSFALKFSSWNQAYYMLCTRTRFLQGHLLVIVNSLFAYW